MASTKKKPLDLHVCVSCGRNDTPAKSGLCRACAKHENDVERNAQVHDHGDEITMDGSCGGHRTFPGPPMEGDDVP